MVKNTKVEPWSQKNLDKKRRRQRIERKLAEKSQRNLSKRATDKRKRSPAKR